MSTFPPICSTRSLENLSLSPRIGEYISPYLFYPISELTDLCPGISGEAIVPEGAHAIGEYISPYLFYPISELTDLCPGISGEAIVPEGAHAIEDLIVGVDAPHSGLAVGDLLETAIDLIPDDAVNVAAGDALAVEDFVVGIDTPHVAFETDGDVLQLPVYVLPSGTRGTEDRVRQKRKENVQLFHAYDLRNVDCTNAACPPVPHVCRFVTKMY